MFVFAGLYFQGSFSPLFIHVSKKPNLEIKWNEWGQNVIIISFVIILK